MPRTVTWDTAYGRQLWEAGVSMNRIAKRFKIRPMTVANYAMRHRWPARVVDKDAVEPPHPTKGATGPIAPCAAIEVYRAAKASRTKLGPADDFAEARLRLLSLTPDTRAA